MNKHIELLIELLVWHWNRSVCFGNRWEHLLLDRRQEYIKFYINNHLKDLWINI